MDLVILVIAVHHDLHKPDLRLVAIGIDATLYLHMKDGKHLCCGQLNHFQWDGLSTLAELQVALWCVTVGSECKCAWHSFPLGHPAVPN